MPDHDQSDQLRSRDPAGSRIVVAMSGGVDSSVTAGLLTEAGYEVIGITLQLYDHGAATGRKGACCAGRDIADARNVAAHLGIPHYVLDYEERFAREVIADFADSYARGETPVPCIRCNERIKFRDLLATARDLGADALATGHYIRSLPGPHGRELWQPADASRDQSYFLFATPRSDLELLRFPLGDLPKSAVREHAARLGLPVASKPDSQDICFVPKGHYSSLVDRLRPRAARAGDIVHQDGRVLGRHEGITHFTIGQRKGLGLGTHEQLFVVALDAVKARVIVGPRSALERRSIRLRAVNWLGDTPLATLPPEGLTVSARVRSTGPLTPARLMLDGGEATVLVPDGILGVSPGQACVLYSDDSGSARILGGGWIASAEASGGGMRPVGSSLRSTRPTTGAV